jgi:hypothetical protein
VEAALVLPLLLMLVFGVVHIAMYHLARQAALSAAQVALTAQQGFHAAPDSGQERAERYLRQVPPVLRDPVIDVRSDDQVVEVTVAGTAISVIPGYRPTVTQTARGPVERVTSP